MGACSSTAITAGTPSVRTRRVCVNEGRSATSSGFAMRSRESIACSQAKRPVSPTPRKADRNRWRQTIVRRLERSDDSTQPSSTRWQPSATSTCRRSSGLFNTTDDLDAYNRVQAVERALGRVQNFVADLAQAALEARATPVSNRAAPRIVNPPSIHGAERRRSDQQTTVPATNNEHRTPEPRSSMATSEHPRATSTRPHS